VIRKRTAAENKTATLLDVGPGSTLSIDVVVEIADRTGVDGRRGSRTETVLRPSRQ